jgi:MFS family permease
MAAVGIGYAPFLWLITRRAPHTRTEEASVSKTQNQGMTGLRQLYDARCYRAMAFAFFWFCAILWMIYAWLPNFIYERFHLSLSDSGRTATLFLQFSTAAGLIAGGFLTDRVTRRIGAGRFYVSAAGLFLAAPFAWLALTVPSLGLLKVSCTCFGFLAGFMISNVFAGPFDVIGRSNYGLGAGTLNTIGGLSGGLAMLLVGRLKESVGIQTLMACGSATAMLAACVMALVASRHFHRDRMRAGMVP